MGKKPEVTESNGNIFADLGIDNADEFYTRACIADRGASRAGIRPALHPTSRRCSSLKYDPIFSVVAPGDLGASPVSVLRRHFHHGLLGVQVMKLLKGRSQRDAARLLGVKQPEISALMRAKFNRFSQARLIGFLNKLDRKVTIQISRHRGKEPYQQVTLTP